LKKKRIFLLVAVTFLLILTYPSIKRATISALFLYDVLKGSEGILAKLAEEPVIFKVKFRSSIRHIEADLYLPFHRILRTEEGWSGGIVLVHGLIDTGKNDPRLIHLAKSLSRAGWVTLVPDFEGMRVFKVRLTDIDEIVDSFIYLSNHIKLDKNKVGLLGFSYGAGPTLLAAADQRIRDKVNFVVSFGGYYDMKNLIRFVTTGTHNYKGEKYFLRPMGYARWAFLRSNLTFIENEKDREILKTIIEIKSEKEEADVGILSKALGPEGRIVFNLLSNRDPTRVDDLISGLRPELKETMVKLSPKGKIADIKAHLFLVHGRDDDAIPFTETLRMAEEVRDKERLHLYILDLFVHVDPSDLRSFPSLFKFYSLVYRFMGFQ
jgi:acetyl esterase/lipase